jgi:hypothetical protein
MPRASSDSDVHVLFRWSSLTIDMPMAIVFSGPRTSLNTYLTRRERERER